MVIKYDKNSVIKSVDILLVLAILLLDNTNLDQQITKLNFVQSMV